MQLEMTMEAHRQRHEQAMEMIKTYGQVFSALAKIEHLGFSGVSSRRRPEIGLNGLGAALQEGLENLRSVLERPLQIPNPAQPNLKDGHYIPARITAEMRDVRGIDEVQNCYLRIGGEDDEYQVIVVLDNRTLGIKLHSEYPSVAPEFRWLDNGLQEVPVIWSEDMSLKQIVQEIQNSDMHRPRDP